VVAPIDPRIEMPEEIRNRILGRQATFRSNSYATTAAFLLSAMTLQPVASRLWGRAERAFEGMGLAAEANGDG